MTNHSPSNGRVRTVSVPLRGISSSAPSKYDSNPSGIVIGLTLSLSWQLAVVVLIPILGGHFLDDRYRTTPWATLLGFAVAMISMVVVLKRTLKQLNQLMKKPVDTANGDKNV